MGAHNFPPTSCLWYGYPPIKFGLGYILCAALCCCRFKFAYVTAAKIAAVLCFTDMFAAPFHFNHDGRPATCTSFPASFTWMWTLFCSLAAAAFFGAVATFGLGASSTASPGPCRTCHASSVCTRYAQLKQIALISCCI